MHRASVLVAWALAWAVLAPCYVASWHPGFVVPRPNDPRFAKVQVWFFLIAVQAATWALCTVFLVSAFRETWKNHPGRRWMSALWAAVPSVLLAGALSLASVGAGSGVRPAQLGGIALNHGVPFAVVGIVIAIAAVSGMFFVRLALLVEAKTGPVDFLAYVFFKSQLQVFLFVAAIILSLGILGTAALRLAVNAEHGADYFPAEYVILYGAEFTLLLLIAYVPVKASFWCRGTALVRDLMGTPPAGHSELVKWIDDKGKIEKALDLDLTSASALIGPVAAILPLLSGWVAILLGGGAKH